jgi:hypothetical protein
MPKYLMLIVENEADFEGVEVGSPKFNEVMQMHGDFTATVEKSGAKILGGEALQPVATATFLRNTRTSDVTVVDQQEHGRPGVTGAGRAARPSVDARVPRHGGVASKPPREPNTTVIVDTSVRVDLFRGNDTWQVKLLSNPDTDFDRLAAHSELRTITI